MISEQPQEIWQGLLVHVRNAGQPGIEEVSMASLRCLDEILSHGEASNGVSDNGTSSPKAADIFDISPSMWAEVWKTYMAIGVDFIDYLRRTTNS